jgi:transposase
MRYELTDFEWDAITSFLPNKPRGGPNVAYGTAAE